MQILWRYSIKNPLTISNCGSSCAKTLGPLIPCSLGSSLISVFSFYFCRKKKKSEGRLNFCLLHLLAQTGKFASFLHLTFWVPWKLPVICSPFDSSRDPLLVEVLILLTSRRRKKKTCLRCALLDCSTCYNWRWLPHPCSQRCLEEDGHRIPQFSTPAE